VYKLFFCGSYSDPWWDCSRAHHARKRSRRNNHDNHDRHREQNRPERKATSDNNDFAGTASGRNVLSWLSNLPVKRHPRIDADASPIGPKTYCAPWPGHTLRPTLERGHPRRLLRRFQLWTLAILDVSLCASWNCVGSAILSKNGCRRLDWTPSQQLLWSSSCGALITSWPNCKILSESDEASKPRELYNALQLGLCFFRKR